MGSDLRQQVDTIFDLVNFRRVNGLVFHRTILVRGLLKVRFREHSRVVLSDIENRLIVGSGNTVFIGMGAWPLIIVKVEPENITF